MLTLVACASRRKKICLSQATSRAIEGQVQNRSFCFFEPPDTRCRICGIRPQVNKMVSYSVFHLLCFVTSAFGI